MGEVLWQIPAVFKRAIAVYLLLSLGMLLPMASGATRFCLAMGAPGNCCGEAKVGICPCEDEPEDPCCIEVPAQPDGIPLQQPFVPAGMEAIDLPAASRCLLRDDVPTLLFFSAGRFTRPPPDGETRRMFGVWRL